MLRYNTIYGNKEYKMNNIYTRLGLTKDNGLYIIDEDYFNNLLPKRVDYILRETLKPESFYYFQNKIFILFFNITSSENIQEEKEIIFKNCWNFNETPIIILNLPNGTFEIYNGFNYIRDNKELEKFDNKDDFSYLSLVTGKILEKYKESFKSSNRVNYYLLENIKDARKLLLNNLEAKVTNSLIGRIIFIRYLIDRKVNILIDGKKQTITNDKLKEILNSKKDTYQLFEYLKIQFNGDMFPILDEEKNVKITDLEILKSLISGTKLSTGEQSLFDIYDFSIIPIEFISNVYEYFIGEENQKKQGAYYTPTFMVDYVLSNTVDSYLNENTDTFNCKVLDPSCGSGIFLVETLRKLISKYIEISNIDVSSEEFKVEIKKILKNNIFGIDKDSDAIMVTIFSLCITLLDYQKPKDIEDFKFPNLLNENFFNSDFFELDAEFNQKFKNIELDFIIGNPPYKRGGGNTELINGYIKDRSKEENKDIGFSNKEIAQAFLIRVSDLSTLNTKISFIITSKIFYNLQAKQFRQYFLNEFLIENVFDLYSVNKEVFEGAVTPVMVISYKSNNKNILKNELQYISLKPSRFYSTFNIFIIEKNDFKWVSQKQLIDNDSLWRILIYGSYLDFNFINKLVNKYSNSINDIIRQDNDLERGQGIMIGGGDKNSTKDYIGMNCIDTEKDFQSFLISSFLCKWESNKLVHRAKSLHRFKAPMLLTNEGINRKTLKASSAISYEDVVYMSSLTAVTSKNPNKNNILKNICGLLQSNYFAYMMLHTGSALVRDQTNDAEKFGIPYFYNNKIVKIVSEIEDLKKRIYEENILVDNNLENELNKLIVRLDTIVFNSLKLTKQEKSLIDYSINLSIPWVMQRNYTEAYKFIKHKSSILKEYIEIFTDYFNEIYKQNNKYFTVEVHYNENVIGIFFRIGKVKQEDPISWQKDNDITNFIKLVGENYTDKIFVQKDIKGFEKDGFYVVKPNEYKNWHTHMAYLDLYEFRDAIYKSGMKIDV